MLYFLKFLYETFLLPPGIFIIALSIFNLWLYRRNRKAFLCLLPIVILFYISSTYWLGEGLIRSLESRYHPPLKLNGDVLVVLGGGSTYDTPNIHGAGHLSGNAANRLLTCVQLYRSYRLPIIISGGRVYRSSGDEAEIAKRILVETGVPEHEVITESMALNTSGNAKYIRELLVKYGFRRPVLITSAFHMTRAVKQFEKLKIKVIPYPTDYLANVHYRFELYQLWPSAEALNEVQMALKEYLGIAVVKWY